MKYKSIEEIIQEIKDKVREAFVTPTFGDNWKTFTKKQFIEAQIGVDEIIDIAWIQGRRAHLLERELTRVLDLINQDDLQLDKIIEGETTTFRDEAALKALEFLPHSGFPILTATPAMIAKLVYEIADEMIKIKNNGK